MENTEPSKLLMNFVSDRWIHSTLKGDMGVVIRWLPITNVCSGGWLGIADTGHWVKQSTHSEIVNVGAANSAIPILSCLERSRSEVEECIVAGLRSLGIPLEVSATFPFADLVLCGLTFGNDYWADLALKWIEDTPLSTDVINALLSITNDKWAGQKIRHRAGSILRGELKKDSLLSHTKVNKEGHQR